MRRAAKLAIVLLLVAAGGALALIGVAPQELKSVATLVDDPEPWIGRDVGLKATVREGSLVRANGTVAFDVVGDHRVLPVRWASHHAVPEHDAGGTLEGRTVVVEGRLARDGAGALVFLAHDMQVGCASKYEPA
ncbi:MAG TPA: cytochrome c maturation protein CcmE [Candidatus Thermoplasmatota archaeon]|nr:cytochrome c maturation protein CcmE [Candidatus Thermoplasmatota archaeon]